MHCMRTCDAHGWRMQRMYVLVRVCMSRYEFAQRMRAHATHAYSCARCIRRILHVLNFSLIDGCARAHVPYLLHWVDLLRTAAYSVVPAMYEYTKYQNRFLADPGKILSHASAYALLYSVLQL